MTLVLETLPDGTSVAAGLSWDVASNGMGRAEARSRAKAAGANAWLLRGEHNLGVMSGALPGAGRVCSLAAALADARSGSDWCGVFEFAGRFVFVAVKDGNVLPDSDRLFEAEEAAKARLGAEAELFETVYAPADWEFAGSHDAAAEVAGLDWPRAAALLVDKQRAFSRRTAVLAAALVISLAGAGVLLWPQEPVPGTPDGASREAVRSLAMPWAQFPTPSASVRACLAVRAGLAAAQAQGWQLNQLSCDPGAKTWTALLRPFTNRSALPEPALVPAPRMSLHSDGGGLEMAGDLAAPIEERTGEQRSLGTALAVRNFTAAVAGQHSWQAAADRSQFSFEVAANLEALAERLGTHPTTSITRIEFTGGLWRVQGEVYH